MQKDIFNPALIQKYATQGPRYTSYPTAIDFHAGFDHQAFVNQLDASNQTQKPLSIYVHIPFCDTVCYYCACNKIITKNKNHAAPYLTYLAKEINEVKAHIDDHRAVLQLHWGGGTPTFLSREEQFALNALLRENFNFVDDQHGEFSIEIDPRTVTESSINDLREMGFNRLSFGIQDFDHDVQRAVNRIQSEDETAKVIHAGRRAGFHSISVDLIYGLPLQTPKSFEKTLNKIIDLSPDRIAVFNYAHLPHIFKTQKQIKTAELPDSQNKLKLLELSIQKLTDAGYVFIGLDHFAKPDDSLVKHQQTGTLYRNFQGYSTFSNCDLLGFGLSAISQVGDSYSQNSKDRADYYAALDKNALPTVRGILLNEDDRIRRHVITEIMCNMRLVLSDVAKRYQINPSQYFAEEIKVLTQMQQDGLLQFNADGFEVLPPGRLLIRHIAMVFDAYLKKANPESFSKVI